MARIVTYVHRYKPPPRKRKAPALEVPAVVTAAKRGKRITAAAPDEAREASPEVKAFFARMGLGRGGSDPACPAASRPRGLLPARLVAGA